MASRDAGDRAPRTPPPRVNLTAWTRLLGYIGDVATLATCEPKALRYRFFHVPARLAHSARRRRLKIPESWPWAAAVFANIAAIPQPA